MAAYIIADIEITDVAQYDKYRPLSTAAQQAHGVEVLARGGKTERLEGRAPGRMVILKFQSMAAAREFYDSPEYRKARETRAGAANMNMVIVDGI
jgi:uncharacterized protein (DUF1330 family)